MSRTKAYKPASIPAPTPEPPKPSLEVKLAAARWVKISDVSYGLVIIDPSSGAVFTHNPTPVPHPSPWVESALQRGILVEV